MEPELSTQERVSQVQATSLSFADAQRQEKIATASRWGSIGVGAALAARGGLVGLATYGAGVASGFLGSRLAEESGAPDLAARAFELFGMHRIGQGKKSQAATVTHNVAHSYAFAGLITGLVVGAVAALAVGALIVATGGAAAAVLIGAAAAGGFTGGFLGTMLRGALSQMGSPTGPITTGSLNVFIAGLPVARMTDVANCSKEPVASPIVEGSGTIFVNSLPMVRVGHKLACGASVYDGSRNIFLDQTTTACAPAASELPLWARITADWIIFLPWGKVAGGLNEQADEPVEREAISQKESSIRIAPRDPKVRQDLDSKWLDEEGNVRWPANRGLIGEEQAGILEPGSTIDRYGDWQGRYASSPEASYESRSLPYDPNRMDYYQFKVLKPLPCMGGRVAPWFDQPGGAMQYRFDTSVEELVDQGYLTPLK